jgi:CDP-diglyceride synthetase
MKQVSTLITIAIVTFVFLAIFAALGPLFWLVILSLILGTPFFWLWIVAKRKVKQKMNHKQLVLEMLEYNRTHVCRYTPQLEVSIKNGEITSLEQLKKLIVN